MASMSSSATSIISTRKKSRSCYDYPPEKDFPNFRQTFGPRGVIHSWATEKDDPTEQPRWGRVGKQKIQDTGPLTAKRMETCDDEFVAAARTSSNDRPRPANRSSCGSTPRTCTYSRTPRRGASDRPADGSHPTTTR